MEAQAARAIDRDQDLEDFLISRQATCNDKTLSTYGFYLRPFVRWLDNRPLSAISIAAYRLARRQAKKSDATIGNDHRMIKTYCRWLLDEGRLTSDPFVGPGRVKPLPTKRRRRQVYTDAEIVKLLAATFVKAANKRRMELTRRRWKENGPYMREARQARALVLLFCDSALRAEEVAKLTCKSVRTAELIVDSKGGHEDVAFIGPVTRSALRELAGNRSDADPLFRDWKGKQCSTRAIRGIIARLAKRAGVALPPRPLHAFRHFAARQWVKAKVPDLAIRQLMRHSNLSTTRIYTELDAAELAALHADASNIQKLLDQAEQQAAPEPKPQAVSARQGRRLRAVARARKRTNSSS